MLSIISYVSEPSVCPPWRSVCSDPLHIFQLGCLLQWSHVSSLYILETKPLSEVSSTNIFSHKVRFLFILLKFSLALQKLFILMKSHLSILSFMSLALGDILVKVLLQGISEIFLPVFSSKAFMVSWLIFAFHPSWVYFYVWCKLVVEFHFFSCSCPDLPRPFVEGNIFTPFYTPAPFVKY